MRIRLPNHSPKVVEGGDQRSLGGNIAVARAKAVDEVGIDVVGVIGTDGIAKMVAGSGRKHHSRVVVRQEISVAILCSVRRQLGAVPLEDLAARNAVKFLTQCVIVGRACILSLWRNRDAVFRQLRDVVGQLVDRYWMRFRLDRALVEADDRHLRVAESGDIYETFMVQYCFRDSFLELINFN